MIEPILKIEIISGNEDLELPSYATDGAAGLDLRAAVKEPITLKPGGRDIISTGLKISIPGGYEGCVRPRSGLAMKHGLTLTNSPGTIDADYRGEVKILMINLGEEPVVLRRGDRIAQLLISPVARAQVIKVQNLDETARGKGGFGHTGLQ